MSDHPRELEQLGRRGPGGRDGGFDHDAHGWCDCTSAGGIHADNCPDVAGEPHHICN